MNKNFKVIFKFILIINLIFVQKKLFSDNFGLGLKGGFGFNYGFFHGKIESPDSAENKSIYKTEKKILISNDSFSTNNYLFGIFSSYSFDLESFKDFFIISLEIGLYSRDINFNFNPKGETLKNSYYSKIFKRLNMKVFDFSIKSYINFIQNEFFTFGLHFGFSLGYLFKSFLNDPKSEVKKEDEEICEKSLSKFLISPIAGMQFLFFDNLVVFDTSFQYNFFDQLKNGQNEIRNIYGEDASVRKNQISLFFEIKFNIWQMIFG